MDYQKLMKRYRELHKMSRNAMGRRLGYTGVTIGNWETGVTSPPVDVFLLIVKEMGLAVVLMDRQALDSMRVLGSSKEGVSLDLLDIQE
jgi:transcriptional regulator with XRE-family HTH domain